MKEPLFGPFLSVTLHSVGFYYIISRFVSILINDLGFDEPHGNEKGCS